MLCNCRRALRSRWYELADAVEAAAEEAARQAEVHAWKSQGAAVKVRACAAQLMSGCMCAGSLHTFRRELCGCVHAAALLAH
jgi:hypothetical protein